MRPKLSVIVPVYNCEALLTRCVESITSQSFQPLELILVDDGSRDGSGRLCDALAAADPRIRVLHQENAGVSAARNAGISAAEGDYLTFADADDYLMDPTLYADAAAALEAESADAVAWLWQYEKAGRLVIDRARIEGIPFGSVSGSRLLEGLYGHSYTNGFLVTACNKLYRRELLDGIPFRYRYNEDDDWSVRVLLRARRVHTLDRFGYVYTETPHSLTRQGFSGREYSFLSILRERAELPGLSLPLADETRRLYCNLFIEYFYRAQRAGIAPPEDQTAFRSFCRCPSLPGRTRLRFRLFLFSSSLYKKLLWKGD